MQALACTLNLKLKEYFVFIDGIRYNLSVKSNLKRKIR